MANAAENLASDGGGLTIFAYKAARIRFSHERDQHARSGANNHGKNPSWTAYEKIREVIEKRMFSQVEDLLPIISFGAKQDSKTEKQHADFLDRMKARGYTERQVRRLVEWYMRVNKAG